MDKLYPPSINGALPAFYADFHNLSEFKDNNNSGNNFQFPDNSYFITCDNTGAANFTVSPDAQLQLVEDTTDLYCYNGLIIDTDNLTGFQQLAIVEKTSDTENNNKFELKFIIVLDQQQDNLKNKRLKIYFTTNRNNYPGKDWIKSQMSKNSWICVEDTVQGYSADIIIPYQNNKSVSLEDITGFALKLKKIQTNTEVCVLRASKDNQTDIKHQINFIIPPENLNKIHPQEFLKAQLAYLYSEDNDDNIGNDEVGYYSTVGIIKYTGKPTIQIQNLSTDNNSMFLLDKYIGEYNDPLDPTEKPIAHCFSLLVENALKKMVLKETSGWINQNSYSFDTDIIDEETNYQIKYQVKTLNGLEEEIIYNCKTPESSAPQLKINLNADNNFDNGYVELSFKPDGWIFNSELQNLQKKAITVNSTNLQLNIENANDNNQIFNAVDDDTLKIALGSELQRQDIAVNDNLLTIMSQMIWPDSNKTLYLYRTTLGSNDWTKIATIQNLSSYDNTFEWSFKDFTIEQGKEYQYGFKEQVTENVTIIKKSEPIIADFEDAFLWDGQRQIRIRFNPKVSSFKTNRLESKVETIGNRYPFIFRNETVEYKEFPISGLISYLADNAELFMSAAELGIILNQYNERTGTPTSVTNVSYNQSETTDLLSYNIKAERIFKLELLDWLGNGEIKLFKSPTEGNYLVRLMNVSLAPEDRLGRMLHSFSCTAYEVKENTDNNLLKLGFFNNKE